MSKEAKASKGALAVVKSHPLVLGLSLAVAIGFAVYHLVKPKKQNKHKYSNSSGRGGGDDDDDPVQSGAGGMLFYDPESKSLTESVPSPNISNNNVKKRKNVQNSPSSSNKDQQENSASPQKNKVSVSREVQTESVDDNQNIDNRKVLPDKNLDHAMSVDEKINNYFSRNIRDPDSSNSTGESDSTNDVFKPVEKCCDCESHFSENSQASSTSDSTSSEPIKKCCCKCDSHSSESSNAPSSFDSISSEPIQKCCCNSKSDTLENLNASSSDSVSSSWSNISFTDVNNMNKASRSPSICSVTSIQSESSLGSILSGDLELCRGCEQNPVNTHTEPCNHRYMCSDCAMRIFRLFKRCKVCRVRIERIVVEE